MIRHKAYYRFLAILLSLTLVISLISPADTARAAVSPRLVKTSQNILVGETYTIQVDNKITGADYIWKSSDQTVAKVNQKGLVTGLKKGAATISCKVKSKTKSFQLECKITVNKAAETISINNKIDYIKIGETYDLNSKMKPSDAGVAVTWSSSDPSILSVDKKGNITAYKLGRATVKATAGKTSDSIQVYVVAQEKEEITKADVVNGVVTLSGKSYGELTVASNVGDSKIVLDHVTIGGTLTMESGAAYTVTTNSCIINKVATVNELVQSFAVGEEENTATPSLIAGQGSVIVTITAEGSIKVTQSDGAVIQSFSVTTKSDGSIEIALEGFKGDLVIDSQSSAPINIAATACEMSSATVKNATDGQAITLSDTNAGTEKASSIGTINMAANAALKVDVKAEEVVIAREVSQADVVISQPVARLTNEGKQTTLMINSEVQSVTSTGSQTAVSLGNSAKVADLKVAGTQTSVELQAGAQVSSVTSTADNTRVNVSEGATIQKLTSYGNSAEVAGTGKVAEAVVTGNDTQINTEGTAVQVATGTSKVSIKGVEVKEEDKIAIATPTPVPTTAPTAAPTVTPKLSVTPTPKASSTPTPKVSLTPTPKPTATPVPTTTPSPTPGSSVITGPSGPSTPSGNVPTSTPTPISTPMPTATPKPTSIPSPTPIVSEMDKLNTYQRLLGEVDMATTALVDNQSNDNYSAVKKILTDLLNQLIAYGDIDSSISGTSISSDPNYLLDYAEYAQVLISQNQKYGVTIKAYYDSLTDHSQTYTLAVGAANGLIAMIARMNTNRENYISDTSAVFASLKKADTGAFYTAMNKLLYDWDGRAAFDASRTEYYYQAMKGLVENDGFINKYYKFDFFSYYGAYVSCNNLRAYFDEFTAYYGHSSDYIVLINRVYDNLPSAVPHYDTDGNYQYADYTLTASQKNSIIAALKEIVSKYDMTPFFNTVTISAEDIDRYDTQIIRNIIGKVYTEKDYEDGYHEILNTYDKNRATITADPKAYDIVEVLLRFADSINGVKEWNVYYLSKYQDKADAVIAAANASNADALYSALLKLYEAKLTSTDGSAEEWRGEDFNPIIEDGKPAIDKDYCLSYIQEKLNAGSDFDENGKPVDSSLYQYVGKKAAANGEDLDQAIYVMRDAVNASNLWRMENYKASIPTVLALMDAVAKGDIEETYNAYCDIYQYMHAKYPNETINPPVESYAPVYYRLLHAEMLNPEWNTDMNRLYHSTSKTSYSLEIAKLENNVLWNITYWLSGKTEAEKQLTEEYDNYHRWNEIMKDIDTFRYNEAATKPQKLAALQNIFTRLNNDSVFMQEHYLKYADGDLAKLDPSILSLDRVDNYWNALSLRIEDETMDSDDNGSWYKYCLHQYDLAITANYYLDYSTVEYACDELVRSVLNEEHRLNLNELMDAVGNDDQSRIHSMLGKINDFFVKETRKTESILLDQSYDSVYLNELKKMLSINDGNNTFYQYHELFINGNADKITFENEDVINNAIYYVQGNLLTPEFYQNTTAIYADTDTRVQKLDAIITALLESSYTISDENGSITMSGNDMMDNYGSSVEVVSGSSIVINRDKDISVVSGSSIAYSGAYTDLVEYAKTNNLFGMENTDLTNLNQCIPIIQANILRCLIDHAADGNGNYSALYYYKKSINLAGDQPQVIYQCLNDIMAITKEELLRN